MFKTFEEAEANRRKLFDEEHEKHEKCAKGYENNVPCAWCGKHNDHTGLPHETGLVVDCDHCGNLNEVVQVIRKPVIKVRQSTLPKPSYQPLEREQWERDKLEAERVQAIQEELETKDV